MSANLIWYGATSALVSGIPILLLPFLLSRLSASDYAQVVSMQIIVMFGGMLITLGLDGSVARDSLRICSRHLAVHVFVGLGTQFTMFLALCALSLVFGRPLEAAIGYPARYLWPTLLGCWFQQITLFTANLLRLLGHVRGYTALSVCQAVLEIGFSLGLLFSVAPGWDSRLWGFVGASCVTALAALMRLQRLHLLRRPRMFAIVLRRMLAFGLPTLPHSIFSLLAAWGDRLILIRFCGSAVAGVYAAAGQSIFVINFVGTVANLAWTPWLYTRLSSRRNLLEQRPLIVRTTYLLGGILVALGIIIFICLWAYFHWAAPSIYRAATPYLPWLALGAIANAVYKVGTGFLFFYGRTRYLAGLAVVVLSLSISAQWWLVPHYEGYASAIIFAGVNLVQMAGVWHVAQRLFLRQGPQSRTI